MHKQKTGAQLRVQRSVRRSSGEFHAARAAGAASSGAVPDCRSCGACCSYSRDWPRFALESDADIDRIPDELVDEIRSGMRCQGNRCSALIGAVGVSTSCGIYDLRPDVCRECEPGDDACLIARRHFDLSVG